MTRLREMVTEFAGACGSATNDEPTDLNRSDAHKRCRLIIEEALEVAEALGYQVASENYSPYLGPKNFRIVRVNQADDIKLHNLASELADLQYTVEGLAALAGLPMPDVLEEVHAANMRKFEQGVLRNASGKITKPPGWRPPNVKRIIDGARSRVGSH